MSVLEQARSASLGNSVSEIFNNNLKLDQDQALKVATIISGNPNFNRQPDYWLYIFNIAPVEFVRHRPVDFPTIRIQACPKGQPYVMAVRVPNTINYKSIVAETGQPSFDSIVGERFCTDLVNPANLSNDMWRDIGNGDMDQMHGGGDDLSRRGVFWSRNQVPTAEELGKAKARMERHYRECIQKADDLARAGKVAEIGAEAHIAADYLHISTSWHMQTSVNEPCPNCGENIKSGVAYHASTVGGICVLDWQRTIASGVKTKADVPEGA